MYIPEAGERTLTDFRQWSKLGGIYYELHPKEKGMMRTRYVSYNTLAGKYQLHLPSNWHHGTPTEEMRPYHDGIGRAVTTMQPAQSPGFY